MKIKKITIFFIIFIFLSSMIFAKGDIGFNKKKKLLERIKNNNEKEFQIGFGVILNSPTISIMKDIKKTRKSIKTNEDYSYSGLSDEEMESILSLDNSMQNDLLFINILKSMEYGLQLRIMHKILITETDISLLPYNYYADRNMQVQLSVTAGVRCPFLIMPYFLAGPVFTVDFNPNEIRNEYNKKGKISAFKKKLIFNLGLNIKTGLDVKLKRFSVGLYYQFKMTGLETFGYWYNQIKGNNISLFKAFKNIISDFSCFGMSFCWYITKKNNKNTKE